jgi:hypothetical protein
MHPAATPAQIGQLNAVIFAVNIPTRKAIDSQRSGIGLPLFYSVNDP